MTDGEGLLQIGLSQENNCPRRYLLNNQGLAACRREMYQRRKSKVQVAKEAEKEPQKGRKSVIDWKKAAYSNQQARRSEVPIMA
jgi:hypothetical protein